MQIESDRARNSRARKAWYKEPASLLALLAVVVSIAATFVTSASADRDRQQRDRDRLADVVAQVNGIINENTRLTVEFGERAPTITSQQGPLETLCLEAFDLINSVGGTTNQQLTIAEVYVNHVGDPRKGRIIAQRLVEEADDGGARIKGLRVIGTVEFQSVRDLEAGRRAYGDALRIFDEARYADELPVTKAGYNSYTELEWAWREWYAQECGPARDHLEKGRSIWESIGSPPGATNDMLNAYSEGIAGCA